MNKTTDEQTCSVVILTSGGVDSSSLINYYLKENEKVTGVFFNYGQPTYERELKSVTAISDYYDIPLIHKELGFQINSHNNGEYYCRNSLLIFAACSLFKSPPSLISIGIHSGTSYYDSSESFIADIQYVLDGYFGGTTRLTAPFIHYSKAHIYEYAILEKVPLELTYSCEVGKQSPCGNCSSCIDRRMLDGRAISVKS